MKIKSKLIESEGASQLNWSYHGKTFLIVDDEVKIAEIIEEFIQDRFGEESNTIKALKWKGCSRKVWKRV